VKSRIIARLEHALDEYRLPGLAIVIRQQNEDLLAGGVGCFDVEGQHKVSERTPYGVASLS